VLKYEQWHQQNKLKNISYHKRNPTYFIHHIVQRANNNDIGAVATYESAVKVKKKQTKKQTLCNVKFDMVTKENDVHLVRA